MKINNKNTFIFLLSSLFLNSEAFPQITLEEHLASGHDSKCYGIFNTREEQEGLYARERSSEFLSERLTDLGISYDDIGEKIGKDYTIVDLHFYLQSIYALRDSIEYSCRFSYLLETLPIEIVNKYRFNDDIIVALYETHTPEQLENLKKKGFNFKFDNFSRTLEVVDLIYYRLMSYSGSLVGYTYRIQDIMDEEKIYEQSNEIFYFKTKNNLRSLLFFYNQQNSEVQYDIINHIAKYNPQLAYFIFSTLKEKHSSDYQYWTTIFSLYISAVFISSDEQSKHFPAFLAFFKYSPLFSIPESLKKIQSDEVYKDDL
ncbi:hypothetical protein EOPP23_07880 [Endozoicomonas sp. OPT23]|uniref:hypothetical protein n=1 Tax=Endozoicomonas sp. OPT23 TaxID=2072845 RepID=UPI00129BCAA5|nr:hypothetical protein [Endozoicomonas sp. OPT23]MRI32902.1 hypothetical protein [Endozoicomonas sp. OPT23]